MDTIADLAILESESDICSVPMIPINNKSIIETTELYYIGYDKDANSLLPFRLNKLS